MIDYKFLPDIFRDSVEAIRPKGDLLSITDNNNNTYTVTVSELSEILINNQYIEIENTVDFNGKYLVQNINYDNLTFEIKKQIGVTIPAILGSYKGFAPFGYFSDDIEYSNFLNTNFKKIKEKKRNFPAIFLQTEFSEISVNVDTFEVTSLNITFFNTTKIQETTPQRHDREMPYLFFIFQTFIQELKKRLSKYENETHIKIYNAELDTDNIVNAIVYNLDLRYKIIKCKI